MENIDRDTVAGFGAEWSRFDQSGVGAEDARAGFETYFGVFPWHLLPVDGGEGVDVGCGSGRWALPVSRRVRLLHLVDASVDALGVARRNLAGAPNVVFHNASVDAMPFAAGSLDFAYSLGVLHHLPDTEAALASVAAALKPGAPLLLYLYYAFDGRPWWFRFLWRLSDFVRLRTSRLPFRARAAFAEVVATGVYWPLARCAALLEMIGCLPDHWPLSFYRSRSFYVMRNDALDRFGTRLERRFTRAQIERMLHGCGLRDLRFSSGPPYWCVAGIKA